MRVFLDVDDMITGTGENYLRRSRSILVFCTEGYFESRNCMRELLRAVISKKPIICLLEPEGKRGGLTSDQILRRLKEAEHRYASWGLTDEVETWTREEGLGPLPSPEELHQDLFADSPIEWKCVRSRKTSQSVHSLRVTFVV